MARKTQITIHCSGTPLTPSTHLPVSLTDNGIFLAYPLDNVEVSAPTLVGLVAEVERVVQEADATPRERAYVLGKYTGSLTVVTAPITRTDARGNATTARHYKAENDWCPITSELRVTPWTAALETVVARLTALGTPVTALWREDRAGPFTVQDVEDAIQVRATKIRRDIMVLRAQLRVAGVPDVE